MFNRGHRAFLLVLVSLSLLWLTPSTMVPRPLASISASLSLTAPAQAAGTIPLSMTQQLDQYGVPLSGCQLYIIQAGTTSTPQNSYKDYGLTSVQPNPMLCDSSGRLPQFFLADGQIKIRLLDKLGNPQVTIDNILVIGPTSGGGSGATIDPTTIAATGDLKQAYGTQSLTGWVRFNGRTIGSSTSGATERANADTQALFLYLWAADANLTVSGGRTTAAADYAANKTITLPDGRGRALSGLDDMGNAAAGRLTSSYFGSVATVLGASGGGESFALTLSQLPTGITSANLATIALSVNSSNNVDQGNSSITYQSGGNGAITPASVGSVTSTGTIPIGSAAVTSNNTSGAAHRTVQPTILVTIYIKL